AAIRRAVSPIRRCAPRCRSTCAPLGAGPRPALRAAAPEAEAELAFQEPGTRAGADLPCRRDCERAGTGAAVVRLETRVARRIVFEPCLGIVLVPISEREASIGRVGREKAEDLPIDALAGLLFRRLVLVWTRRRCVVNVAPQ